MTDDDRHTIGYDIPSAVFVPPVGMPTCRETGRELYEIRSNLADDRISRVFFCGAERRMVLLHGMLKKTQTTPKIELDLACGRMKEICP